MATNIPVILIDTAGFDLLAKTPDKRAVLTCLEELMVTTLRPFVGCADPRKAFHWHGTGDGYYLWADAYPPAVTMRFALDLEGHLRQWNQTHPDFPLRLRIGLTFGDVEQVGQQWLSDAFTEATRLIDAPRVKALFQDQGWPSPAIVVTSALFMNTWQADPEREAPALAIPPALPWTRVTFQDKHGKPWVGYLQAEEALVNSVQVAATPTAQAAAVDFAPWLRQRLHGTASIKIGGIGNGRGFGREVQPFYPIEELYTTLRSRGGPAGEEQAMAAHGPGSLAAWLPRHPRLLIEGLAGAGKTTFLHLTFTMLARDFLSLPGPEGGTWCERYLGLTANQPPRLPLLVKLSRLVPRLHQAKHTSRALLLELLAEELPPEATPGERTAWRRAWDEELAAGRCHLLLDGLDEVADEASRDQLRLLLLDMAEGWGSCPLVVSSRPFQTGFLSQMGFHPVQIEPFAAREIREFLDRWVAVLHGLPLGQCPAGDGGGLRQQLEQAIMLRPEIRRMATNPVMLTCLCVVHWNEGQLPEGRSRVYQAVTTWLRRAREGLRTAHGFADPFAEAAFPLLALAMMAGSTNRPGKRASMGKEDAAHAVVEAVARHFPTLTAPADHLARARAWLEFEAIWSGLIEDTGAGEIRFWHLTFQEYLAARQLVLLPYGSDHLPGWWSGLREHLDDPQWQETVSLFPGCLFDANGQAGVDDLLQRVLADRPKGTQKLVDDARIAGVMGRLLAPMTVYGYHPPAALEGAYRQVLERAMAIFTRHGASQVPIKARIEAAEALGRAGDPRLLDQPQLIEVPGSDGWRLGRYPVTVAEYHLFVSHDGYREQGWWGEAGWRWRQKEGSEGPDRWEDQLMHPNRPVTGISWFEAMAYCRWLSERQGETIRLPDESVWQRAATAPCGDYPWGKAEPTPELANFDGKVKSPTPVGLYPDGDGPHGHADLAGNVWEWQRNLYQTKTPSEAPLDPEITEGENGFTLRGGSWDFPSDYLRSAGRGGLPAGGRVGLVGFRVAAAPASR